MGWSFFETHQCTQGPCRTLLRDGGGFRCPRTVEQQVPWIQGIEFALGHTPRAVIRHVALRLPRLPGAVHDNKSPRCNFQWDAAARTEILPFACLATCSKVSTQRRSSSFSNAWISPFAQEEASVMIRQTHPSLPFGKRKGPQGWPPGKRPARERDVKGFDFS